MQKKGASVSEELALFNWSSVGVYVVHHLVKINIVNFNNSSRYLEVELKTTFLEEYGTFLIYS